MHARSGELLAAASAPRFDPNVFARGNGDELATLLSAPAHPLFDRAIRMAIPPGSVSRFQEGSALDPALYAAHSLRSGFITSAAESGASILKMVEVSRHKSVDVLRGYVRRADMFKEHAGAAFM